MVLDDDERDRMFGSAVGDSTLTDGLDTLEFVNNDEESFFKNSKRDTSILTKGNANDAAFHDKYDSLQQSNIGRFSDVLDSIAVGNNQVALQMLSQITPDNIIETNKKFILTIIATGYNPGLDIDGDTISPITDIANTHPFYGGDAVYWGRGILHLLVKDVLSASRHAQTAATPKNSNQENVLKGKLFPNPTSDAVTFIYPLDKKQNGTVIINDAYNNEIATYKLKQTTLTINALNFSAGVYFLHVYIDDIIAETHRLVIIK